MSQDHILLKEAVVDLWCGSVSVQSTATENFFKSYEKLLGISLDDLTKDFIKSAGRKFCEFFLLKTDFENYFDNHGPFQLDSVIVTGSISEGLILVSNEAPDIDLMCVLKNITFSQKDQEDGSLVLREDTPFTYAFVRNAETRDLWRDFLEKADKEGGCNTLSSRKLKEKMEKNYTKTDKLFPTLIKEDVEEIAEGAAVTVHRPQPALPSLERIKEIVKEFLRQPIEKAFPFSKHLHEEVKHNLQHRLFPSTDIVLSISCEGWPRCANEWITRERFWPDIKQVEKITQSGFHIVPKSSPKGDFRLSFSCAETMLIETLSPLQHKIMRAFKVIIKHHLNIWSPHLRDTLSSYHLKTIAFWHFEKSSQELWTDDTIVHHIVSLHNELVEALRTQNLPMYFMPKFNLFGNVDDPESMLELMAKVSNLSRDLFAMSECVETSSINFLAWLIPNREIFKWHLDEIVNELRIERFKKRQEGGEIPFTPFELVKMLTDKIHW